uniref:Si:ch211-1e14.1 n=1 Tax=Scophthalmus maximus TaxID=52904 RepID=A0A8D3AFZ2_SCOMX
MGLLGDGTSSTRSSPSSLPTSHHTAFESLDSPGGLSSITEPNHEARTAYTLFHWAHVPSENSKPFMPSVLPAEEPQPLPTTSLSPSEHVLGSSPQFEAPAKLSTDWRLARINPVKQSSPLSPTLKRPQRQSQSNTSLTPLSPTTSRLSLTSGQKALDATLTAPKKQQDDVPEQMPTIMASQPGQPLEPPNLAFTDYPADESYSKILDVNQLSPSRAPLQENKPAHGINMLPNSDELLAPGYNVPFSAPHLTSPLSQPTEVAPEDFYPTNTMEFDWGSGDYLETMSFLNADGDDYALVTKVPSDSYEAEDYTESYDTSFPSRVGISPSSLLPLHISPSPSLVTEYSTIVPLTSIHPSSFSSTIHYTLEPTPTANSDTPDASDVDWPDTFTIQPTDVLLPDMNSLEYYTIQLTKENDGSDTGAEHRGNVTVVAVPTTEITPTSNFTSDTKPTEEESSSDPSGFEPHGESTTEVTTEQSPQLVNVSEPFLDPSIVPSYFLDSSSSIWGGKVPATDWSAPTPTVGLDSTAFSEDILPHATSLLPDYVLSSSSMTDVHWFVTEPFMQSSIHTTPVLTATVAFSPGSTELVANTTAGATDLTPQDWTFTTEQIHNISLVSADSISINSTKSGKTTTTAPTTRQYLCNLDNPAYLVKIGFPSGATVGYAKSQVRDILKVEFNKSVELQVVDPPPKFMFRVVSGPVVYTAISVINSLRKSGRRFLSVSPNWITPDSKYQVHTVLQFVPIHIDVRFCNFSESIKKGLTMAFAEVRRRSKESTNFTVHVSGTRSRDVDVIAHFIPVDITFTVRGSRGYLMGSEISNALIKLTMVEFSYYMGFPVQQIAEPFHYPELNTSQLLRASWVRTVLLGVLDQKAGERTFQANMERRVAMLLGEAMGLVRRVKRATAIGNSSVQVVSASRLMGDDHPLEIVYFVEGPSGQRLPAVQAANLLNGLDVQRAAIVLGYRVQGILALPVEKVTSSPSDTENTNIWIVVGVVIPLLVVIVIISILYWKLCRTDKLEFQPDAMTSIQQQRQKLQAPSVKGFDFAKLHLGQQSKDDVMVIQEPGPLGPGPGSLPLSLKDGLSPSENGEIPTPMSRHSASSTKASRSGRRRERISPSDGDSVVSDHSSEREATEENQRAHATPSDSKQTRKLPINVLNGPPPMNGPNEQLSSASIFEHVDRMSRAAEASRRLPNKVQLIAMQPIPVPPLHSPPINGKLSDANQINKEIQVALRHKSEIEHHRNKIRLRAKRKGHYDFPAMDDVNGNLGDAKDQDRIYHKAQMQIDKILDPDVQMPSIFMDSKKSGRGRRSPKQRMKEQLNGDKDHLITDDSEAAYRKCPGVNNVAYVVSPAAASRTPTKARYPLTGAPPPPTTSSWPSIEEARQQMHSLLDDAFALVSPTSQGSTAGITLPGVGINAPGSSPPGRGPRAWGPNYPPLAPFPSRFTELSLSPPSVQGLTPRQGLGSSYLPPGDAAGLGEQFQPDSLYSGRGLYADELPSSARPRPVGGTTGAQFHHLTQVGLSSRLNGYPAGARMPRSGIRDPSAPPPAHLDPPVGGYMSAPPPLDTSPPNHSSASLIKAIREELLRLSQKQAAMPGYHS